MNAFRHKDFSKKVNLAYYLHRSEEVKKNPVSGKKESDPHCQKLLRAPHL